VELVAEGDPEQVAGFLEAIARRMAGHVTRTTVREAAPAGHEGFSIRH
jgi:hypothetical protein